MPDRAATDRDAPASSAALPQWSAEETSLALDWLLLFRDGHSRPLPARRNELWMRVAIDALQACGAVSELGP